MTSSGTVLRGGLVPAGFEDDDDDDMDDFGQWDDNGTVSFAQDHVVPPEITDPWRKAAYGDAAEHVKELTSVRVDKAAINGDVGDGGDAWKGPVMTEAEQLREAILDDDGQRLALLMEGARKEALLEKDCPGMWGGRPVVLAAREARRECLGFLLRLGASLKADADGYTPLMSLCAAPRDCRDEDGARAACASLFFELRPDETEAGARQCQMMTALMFAAKQDRADLCSLLLEKGARVDDADTQDWTPLCFAADGGHGAVVRLLLEAGANPDLATREGLLPAELAGSKGYLDLQTVIEKFSKKKSLLRGESFDALERNKGRRVFPGVQGFRRYSELDGILMGMNLNDYTAVFERHRVSLEQFLTLREKDLVDMGVTEVGVRLRILDGIAEMHKSEWRPTSLPRVTARDKQRGIYFSCPDCVAMVANVAHHARLLSTATVYMTGQVRDHPDLLRIGKDVADVAQLRAHAADAAKRLRLAAIKMDRFEDLLDRVASKDPELAGSADKIGPKSAGAGRWKRKAKAATVVGVAGLAGYVIYRWLGKK